VKIFLEVAGGLVALIAAALWFWSASIKLPIPTWAGVGQGGDFLTALAYSAKLNQWAAAATGAATLLLSAATFVKR
jgi:hypothetical protein